MKKYYDPQPNEGGAINGSETSDLGPSKDLPGDENLHASSEEIPHSPGDASLTKKDEPTADKEQPIDQEFAPKQDGPVTDHNLASPVTEELDQDTKIPDAKEVLKPSPEDNSALGSAQPGGENEFEEVPEPAISSVQQEVDMFINQLSEKLTYEIGKEPHSKVADEMQPLIDALKGEFRNQVIKLLAPNNE